MLNRIMKFLVATGFSVVLSSGHAFAAPPNKIMQLPFQMNSDQTYCRPSFGEFVAYGIKPGKWESAGNGQWIYRIKLQDKMSRKTNVVSVLFVPVADKYVAAGRVMFNQRSLTLGELYNFTDQAVEGMESYKACDTVQKQKKSEEAEAGKREQTE